MGALSLLPIPRGTDLFTADPELGGQPWGQPQQALTEERGTLGALIAAVECSVQK